MNTAEVADKLGTTPRILRQFLRHPSSTFVAVGSGSRYDFRSSDLPMLEKRFNEWQGSGKPKASTPKRKTTKVRKSPDEVRAARDREVWEEEGPVQLEDIRDPRVRARVRADAKAAEDRLMMLLMSKGRHVTQMGDQQ